MPSKFSSMVVDSTKETQSNEKNLKLTMLSERIKTSNSASDNSDGSITERKPFQKLHWEYEQNKQADKVLLLTSSMDENGESNEFLNMASPMFGRKLQQRPY